MTTTTSSRPFRRKYILGLLAVLVTLAIIATYPTTLTEPTEEDVAGVDPDDEVRPVDATTAAGQPSDVPGQCPAANSASIDGLKNTGRKALVVYSAVVTQAFSENANGAMPLHTLAAEHSNFDFFLRYGVVPDGWRTALFSGVDYVIIAVNSTSAEPRVVCGQTQSNIRIISTNELPCELCAVPLAMDYLRLAGADPDSYEFIHAMSSAVRGPFFTPARPAAAADRDQTQQQQHHGAESPNPSVGFSWLDHVALGGRNSYRGDTVSTTALHLDRHVQAPRGSGLETVSIGLSNSVLLKIPREHFQHACGSLFDPATTSPTAGKATPTPRKQTPTALAKQCAPLSAAVIDAVSGAVYSARHGRWLSRRDVMGAAKKDKAVPAAPAPNPCRDVFVEVGGTAWSSAAVSMATYDAVVRQTFIQDALPRTVPPHRRAGATFQLTYVDCDTVIDV